MELAPVFTVVRDKQIFEKTITQTLNRSELPADMQKAVLGQTLTGANGATAKVIKADDTNVTLEIQNVGNPFYDKKIAVGVSADDPTGDAIYKITKISGTGITLEVTNKRSPFYNKKFAIGESTETPQGKLIIKNIEEEKVEIAVEHPLMGKTLFFDVEVTDIQ
jgi:hypothetical protein